VTNLLSLAINYVDRFVLGALQSTLAVGQFVIAQEVVTKLWIASGAVISAATPRLAMVKHQPDFELMKSTSRHLTRLMIWTGLLPALGLMLFGEVLLKLWLGKSFTQSSVFPLQVMAAGVGLNNLSQVNFTLLQVFEGEFGGAMLQVFNLAFAGVSLVILIPRFGVNGAAYAFSLRLLADCFIGRSLLSGKHDAGSQLGVSNRFLMGVAAVFATVLYFCYHTAAV
jgi:O-antigen/teichoic acid export membrane protein